jgi:glyoxylase-like metal-dependent hydrolase (beta-lactamase superfamily II)
MSVLTARARAPSPAPQQVALGVYLVTLGRGAAASNAYLVGSGSAWALVDAAWATSAEAIRTAAEAVFGPGAHPAAILLTHIHPDHSGAAGTPWPGSGKCRCTSIPTSCRWRRQVPAAVRRAAGPVAGRPDHAPPSSEDT